MYIACICMSKCVCVCVYWGAYSRHRECLSATQWGNHVRTFWSGLKGTAGRDTHLGRLLVANWVKAHILCYILLI